MVCFIEVLSEEINKTDPSCMLHPGIYKKYNSNKETALQQEGLKSLSLEKNNGLPNYASPSVAVVNGGEFLKNKILKNKYYPFYLRVK